MTVFDDGDDDDDGGDRYQMSNVLVIASVFQCQCQMNNIIDTSLLQYNICAQQ